MKRPGIPKRSRYGVARVVGVGGRSFMSKWEADGAAVLELEKKAGAWDRIEYQVTFTLYLDPHGLAFVRCKALNMNVKEPGIRIEAYICDALAWKGERYEILDWKHGLLTDTYKRKSRWMKALGLPITEMHKGRTR